MAIIAYVIRKFSYFFPISDKFYLYNHTMELVNLIEDTQGSPKCINEHGLSFYIKTLKHKILFDLGPSDQTLANASALGVDISSVDTVILSHGHYDHSGGILPFVKNDPDARIYMQVKAAEDYYAYDGPDKGYRYIGIDPLIPALQNVYPLNGCCEIDDELEVIVANERPYEIPLTNDRLVRKDNGEYVKDDFAHEHSLVIRSEDISVLICGCAHSGILNIIEAYKERYSSMPDYVIGGFHMMRKSGETEEDLRIAEETAWRLKETGVKFYTCHCTGIPAYETMKKIMGDSIEYIHCGDRLSLP